VQVKPKSLERPANHISLNSEQRPNYQIRLLLAGVLGPAVGIALALLITTAWASQIGVLADPSASYLPTLFFFLFFGMPLSLVVEALVGRIGWVVLSRRGQLNGLSIISVAGLVGGSLYGSVFTWVFPLFPEGGLPHGLGLLTVGFIGGAVAGAVLWFGALRRGAF
jgi:hypothetical protein